MEGIFVLSTVHRERSTYGVGQHDYARYLVHCTRKVARLRKSLGLVQAARGGGGVKKGAFQKKPVTASASDPSDPRRLQLQVFQAERSWARAQALRTVPSSSTFVATENLTSKQRHAIFRLLRSGSRSAHNLLQELENSLSSNRAIRVLAEAKVYSLGFESQIGFMKSQSSALGPLCSSWKVLDLLSRLQDQSEKGSTDRHAGLEARALALQQMDELEPMIRFCQYHVNKSNSAIGGKPGIEDIVSHILSDPQSLPDGLSPILQHLQQAIGDQTEDPRRPLAVFRGRGIQVRNVEVSRAILQTQEAIETLDKHFTSGRKTSSTHKLNVKGMVHFDAALSALRDAEARARRAAEQTQIARGSTVPLAHSYITLRHLTVQIARDMNLIHDSLARLAKREQRLRDNDVLRSQTESINHALLGHQSSRSLGPSQLDTKLKKSRSSTYPVVVKLLDGVIRSWEAIRDLDIVEQDTGISPEHIESLSPRDGSGAADLFGFIEGKVAEMRAIRCLYLGRIYGFILAEHQPDALQCLRRGEVYVRQAQTAFSGVAEVVPSVAEWDSIVAYNSSSLNGLRCALKEAQHHVGANWFVEREDRHDSHLASHIADLVGQVDTMGIATRAGLKVAAQPLPKTQMANEEGSSDESEEEPEEKPRSGFWGFFSRK